MLPALRASKPMSVRSVVVLPAPLRPISVTISPAFTSNEIPCTTWLRSYQGGRSRTSSNAMSALPQVDAPHFVIGADLFRRSPRQELAVMQHDQPAADA